MNFQQSGRELLTPDEVRLLDNRKAVLLVRGERPILDEKYDLHKHVNVKYTEDGGAPPYDYAKAPLSHEDVTIDTRRLDDYELLSAEEILGGSSLFDWRNAIEETNECQRIKQETIPQYRNLWEKDLNIPLPFMWRWYCP